MTEDEDRNSSSVATYKCRACGVVQPVRRYCTSCGESAISATPRHSQNAETNPRHLGQETIIKVEPPHWTNRLPHAQPAGTTKTIHWLGTHGGAGETTLEKMVPGTTAMNHAWPTKPLLPGDQALSIPVILVARSHITGLTTAQHALKEWASGGVHPVRLLGLVVIADTPVKPPKQLRTFQKVVMGGAPESWEIPYMDSFRTSEPEYSESLNLRLSMFRRSIQSIAENL